MELVLSTGITYIFSVTVSMLNRPESVHFMVDVSWDDKLWSTSFDEQDISKSCSFITKYITDGKCTLEDHSRVYYMFFVILEACKEKREKELTLLYS